jgi:hypothetical protein
MYLQQTDIMANVYRIAKNTFEKYILHTEVHIYILVLITDECLLHARIFVLFILLSVSLYLNLKLLWIEHFFYREQHWACCA